MLRTLIAAVLLSIGFTALADDAPAASKKLYHVVSVKFKADAAADKVADVEKAFVELKSKIPGILSLDWGTNSSPEKRNHGFTHCFVLTFGSDADRDAYLVHADHKAFGKVLHPVMEDVMVLDFWANPADPAPSHNPVSPAGPKILHVVSLKFKESTTKEQTAGVLKAFAALPSQISNVASLAWGSNVSPEKHDHRFTQCFVLGFENESDRDAYLTSDAHKAFVGIAVPAVEDVMVIDFLKR